MKMNKNKWMFIEKTKLGQVDSKVEYSLFYHNLSKSNIYSNAISNTISN